ncbi:hypothetical protein D3C83_153830 [compost metagenome]
MLGVHREVEPVDEGQRVALVLQNLYPRFQRLDAARTERRALQLIACPQSNGERNGEEEAGEYAHDWLRTGAAGISPAAAE